MKVMSDTSLSVEAAILPGEPKSLSASVVHRLELEILKGQRKPGDRLDERQLADHFGVSRTPVREALQRLAASGWWSRAVARACRSLSCRWPIC